MTKGTFRFWIIIEDYSGELESGYPHLIEVDADVENSSDARDKIFNVLYDSRKIKIEQEN